MTNHCLSVLWRCWLGHTTRKIVYAKVSSGTLDSTIPVLYINKSLRVGTRCDVCVDGAVYVSVGNGVYGSNVRERAYWGGGDYSAWIDFSNSLPPGLLQRFFVFAQPTANADRIGTAVSRIQIWRQSSWKTSRRAFQLVWQRRVLVLPCNRTHGALRTVS